MSRAPPPALGAESQSEIILALLTPYLAFWPPHALGGSGVLAAVAGGLFVSCNGPRLIPPATRLQGYFVWGLVNHAIEGLLFLLIGLQARTLAGLAATAGSGWSRRPPSSPLSSSSSASSGCSRRPTSRG